MSLAENKVHWCLVKAQKELKDGKKHRGLVKIYPHINLAKEHIKKAEHYLRATIYLKKGAYTDICASTLFYTAYHSLLAIAVKLGYESRNQECTFALMYALSEEKKISLPIPMLEKISSLKVEDAHEKESLQVRELYQYGTALTLEEDLYQELFEVSQEILSTAKEIIER